MQETLQALLGLQDIDRHIFKVEAELRRLPVELERRKTQLERLQAGLDERRRVTTELRSQVREVENVTTQQRQRQRKLENETNKTSDAALIAAYEHEIRTLKRTVSQAEDDGLRMIEKAEQFDLEVAELERQVAEELTTFDEFRANVERETAAAETRLGELKAELDTRSSDGIDKAQLDLYRGLLATREGEAMAELEGRICQGCYVEIPKNLAVQLARGIVLIQCPSCNRILHLSH